MNGFFIFNNRKSTEVGLRVSGFSTYDAPKRSYESVVIPGRNGTLHIDNGRFENISVSYEASLTRDFQKNSVMLREWLLAPVGYCRLEDSYHLDTFRLARYDGGISFSDFTQLCRAANVKLNFDCKPQRFLKIGELPVENPQSVFNPTSFHALPIVAFTLSEKSATIIIGNCRIVATGATIGDTIIIDSETMDAVGADGENRNSLISISEEILLAGNATTTISSIGTSNLTIIPRWWTI